MRDYLTIGKAAKRLGLTPKTIRCYEEIGLIPAFQRSRSGLGGNGYRVLTRQDLNRLEFVKRARRLGLSLAQVKELLTATERGAASRRLAAFIEQKLSEVDQTVEDLQSLRRGLAELLRRTKAKPEPTPQSCCEPVCGPITCEPESRTPVLVQVGRSERR